MDELRKALLDVTTGFRICTKGQNEVISIYQMRNLANPPPLFNIERTYEVLVNFVLE